MRSAIVCACLCCVSSLLLNTSTKTFYDKVSGTHYPDGICYVIPAMEPFPIKNCKIILKEHLKISDINNRMVGASRYEIKTGPEKLWSGSNHQTDSLSLSPEDVAGTVGTGTGAKIYRNDEMKQFKSVWFEGGYETKMYCVAKASGQEAQGFAAVQKGYNMPEASGIENGSNNLWGDLVAQNAELEMWSYSTVSSDEEWGEAYKTRYVKDIWENCQICTGQPNNNNPGGIDCGSLALTGCLGCGVWQRTGCDRCR